MRQKHTKNTKSDTQTHSVRNTKMQRQTQRPATRRSVSQARWERDKKHEQNSKLSIQTHRIRRTHTQRQTEKRTNRRLVRPVTEE